MEVIRQSSHPPQFVGLWQRLLKKKGNGYGNVLGGKARVQRPQATDFSFLGHMK